MALYKALYGAPCRTPVCWIEAGEKPLDKLDIVQETKRKIKEIRENMRIAQDRQKKYANKNQKPIEFRVGDMLMLKVF